MDSLIFDSQVNQTAGASETPLVSGLPRYAVHLQYAAETDDSASAGLLFFSFRWKDREGTARIHTSAGLALGTVGAAVEKTVNLYLEDDEAADITIEITAVGVLGTYRYSYWVQVDGAQGN